MNGLEKKIVELYPWMREKARFYFRGKEDVEDLVSETILRLLKNKDKYDNSFDLKPWCSVVMKNLYNNWYQRSKTVPFIGYEEKYSPKIEDTFDYNEMMSIIDEQSNVSLNVYCVKLYVLGFSYEEISDMLDVKIGTVRSRIFNGRKILKLAFNI